MWAFWCSVISNLLNECWSCIRKEKYSQVLQYLTEHRTLWFLISVVMVTEWWSLKLSHGKCWVQVNVAEPPTSRFITFSGSIVLESSQSIIHLVKVANQHTIKAKLSAVIQLRQNFSMKILITRYWVL